MSKNEVAKTESGEVTEYQQSDNPFADAADDMGSNEGQFLKFNGKTGQYIYGQEDDVLFSEDDMNDDINVRVAVDMNEFRRGWMCWIDEEVKDEVTRNVLDGPALREAELPDYSDEYTYEKGSTESDDGWVQIATVPFRDIETGDQYLFKASSKGAYKALGKFLKAYSET